MSIADIKAEDRRAEILRLLAADSQGAATDDMLHRALGALGPAFRASSDQVRGDLTWLSEQGLLTLERLRDDMIEAVLTRHGRDVAAGDARIPGVSHRTRGR